MHQPNEHTVSVPSTSFKQWIQTCAGLSSSARTISARLAGAAARGAGVGSVGSICSMRPHLHDLASVFKMLEEQTIRTKFILDCLPNALSSMHFPFSGSFQKANVS